MRSCSPPLSKRGLDRETAQIFIFIVYHPPRIYMSHITYLFFLCNFWPATFLLNMILRATIGRRCMCRVIHFFLSWHIPPFVYQIFFYPFQWHWDNQIWDEIFSLLLASTWKLSLMNYWSFSLWTCTLIMDLGGTFLTANGFFSLRLFPISPYLPLLPLLPVSLCFILSFLFVRFCVSVQMYEMCQVPYGLVDVDVSPSMWRVYLIFSKPVLSK